MQQFPALIATFLALAGAVQEPQAPPSPAPRITVEALDRAILRGARWLRGQAREDGSFAPESERNVCALALSAMATWSLNEPEPRCLEAAEAERAARYLISNVREDGGIYDPARGLAVYTSGVAARALRTLGPRGDWPELGAALAGAELFHYRHAAPESIVDAVKAGELPLAKSAEAASELLRESSSADPSRRKALEFLARNRETRMRAPSRLRPALAPRDASQIGPFTYDDLLPFVYFDVAPDQQLALRARAALVLYYTPDRNPDLTRRYGDQGFRSGTQGLYYYYFVAAKALSTFSQPVLVTADGASHDWADELGTRLARLQRPDGAWANSDGVWWESEPVLATSYALLTLKLCRASLLRDAAKR
jgi:hypothetical protein